MAHLTLDRLRQILRYDPDTGVFTWLATRKRSLVGRPAGNVVKNGDLVYRKIQIGAKTYAAHRLAWFYMTGQWPAAEIDHENREGLDNRWDNLRPATDVENGRNKKCYTSNSLGLKGVSKHSRGWRARITTDNGRIHLGVFDSPTEAHAAYARAAEQYHGEFARVA